MTLGRVFYESDLFAMMEFGNLACGSEFHAVEQNDPITGTQVKGHGKGNHFLRTVEQRAAAHKVGQIPASKTQKAVAKKVGESVGKLPASQSQKLAAQTTGKLPVSKRQKAVAKQTGKPIGKLSQV